MHDIVRNVGLYFPLESTSSVIVFSFLADFFEVLIKNIDIFLLFYFTYCNLGVIIALVTHSQIIYHFKKH